MNVALQKRFWENVTVREATSGFCIFLDEKPLKTPLKTLLVAPNRAVADGIAAEWDGVQDKLNLAQMHLTRCANATIDKVAHEHGAVAGLLAEYGGTDLLCYRAKTPQELVLRQSEAWDPLLEWIAKTHGVNLLPVSGVMFQPQPADSLEKLETLTRVYGPWELTALHDLVTISGSLVLGLAVVQKHLTAQQAWDLSQLDELWQEEQWGTDEEATQNAALKCQDFIKAEYLLKLLAHK